MKAIVSGQAAKAVYWKQDGVWCLPLDATGPVQCSADDVPYLMGEATDLRAIDVDSPEEVVGELELSWSQDRALHLMFVLLDPDAEDDSRREAAEYLDEFFANTVVREFIVNRFYSAELPEQADLVGAIVSASTAEAGRVVTLLEETGESQPKIRVLQDSFSALPTTLFGDQEARQLFRERAVTSGAWSQLVQAAPERIGEVRYTHLLPGSPLRELDPRGRIMAEWTKDLRASKRLPPPNQEEDEFRGQDIQSRSGKAKKSYEVFETVKRQKEAIKHAISANDLRKFRKYVRDLISYQRLRSEESELAKSLCDLASFAKEVGAHQLQLELTTNAVKEAPADGWAQIQLADAYLRNNKFSEALTTYEQSEQSAVARGGHAEVLKALGELDEARTAYEAVIADFPHDVVARAGRAEVLKALGELDEARTAYEAVIADFPHDVVARAGRAEVLKALGELDEARTAYEAVIADFPRNVVARNGRAEVLKALGELDEARTAYEAVIADFPHDVVARAGRAEVLKALGELDEARTAYEAVIADFPRNVVARNGRAEVLKALGELDEARTAYEAVIADFPHDVVARNGRAEVLKALGELDEARTVYEAVIADFPHDVVARNGRAEVLKALGELDEARTVYEAVIADFPRHVVARNGRAEVLKALGELDEARTAYEAVIADFPHDVVARAGRAEVLKALGELDEARTAYEAVIADFPRNVVARNGRAEVLKALGELDEARTAYEAVIADFPHDVVARATAAPKCSRLSASSTRRAPRTKPSAASPTTSWRATAAPRCSRLSASSTRRAPHRTKPSSPTSPHDVVARAGRAEVLKVLGELDEARTAYEAVIADFPRNVVARNGRAEVLKALGELDEARTEYEAVIADFPHDEVAHAGLLSVLVLGGRYDAALQLRRSQAPVTFGDWVEHHICGMALLKKGHFGQAVAVFEEGLNPKMNAWAEHRPYFRNALALAKIQRRQFQAVLDMLEAEAAPLENLLRAHALFELERADEAKEALNNLPERSPTRVIELSTDLRKRYAHKAAIPDSDRLIFKKECDLILLAA